MTKTTKAIIYTRGEGEAMQELKCRAYAKDMGYEVLYVTKHIEDISLCDVMLVANFSRISRKQMEFAKTYKFFKARGIRIESATDVHDIEDVFLAKDIYKALDELERKFKKQD